MIHSMVVLISSDPSIPPPPMSQALGLSRRRLTRRATAERSLVDAGHLFASRAAAAPLRHWRSVAAAQIRQQRLVAGVTCRRWRSRAAYALFRWYSHMPAGRKPQASGTWAAAAERLCQAAAWRRLRLRIDASTRKMAAADEARRAGTRRVLCAAFRAWDTQRRLIASLHRRSMLLLARLAEEQVPIPERRPALSAAGGAAMALSRSDLHAPRQPDSRVGTAGGVHTSRIHASPGLGLGRHSAPPFASPPGRASCTSPVVPMGARSDATTAEDVPSAVAAMHTCRTLMSARPPHGRGGLLLHPPSMPPQPHKARSHVLHPPPPHLPPSLVPHSHPPTPWPSEQPRAGARVLAALLNAALARRALGGWARAVRRALRICVLRDSLWRLTAARRLRRGLVRLVAARHASRTLLCRRCLRRMRRNTAATTARQRLAAAASASAAAAAARAVLAHWRWALPDLRRCGRRRRAAARTGPRAALRRILTTWTATAAAVRARHAGTARAVAVHGNRRLRRGLRCLASAAARTTIAHFCVAYNSSRQPVSQRIAFSVWRHAARVANGTRNTWARAERAALSRARVRVGAAWRCWRVRLPVLRARRREAALARWAHASRSIRRALACWLCIAWQKLRSADAAAAAARWGGAARLGIALAMRTWRSAAREHMQGSRRRSASRAALLRRAIDGWRVAARRWRVCGVQAAIGASVWRRHRAWQALSRIRLEALEEARIASRTAFAAARAAASGYDEGMSRVGSAWLAWRCAARQSRFAATSLLLARRAAAGRAVRAWAQGVASRLLSEALFTRAAQHAAHAAAAAAFDALATAFDCLRTARALADVLLAARRVRTTAVRDRRLTRGWVAWAAAASALAAAAVHSRQRWQVHQRRAALRRWCAWSVERGTAAERMRRAAAMLCTSLLVDVRARLARLRSQPSARRLHPEAGRNIVGSSPLSACSSCPRTRGPALRSEDQPCLPRSTSVLAASAPGIHHWLDSPQLPLTLSSHAARPSHPQLHSLERCGIVGGKTLRLDNNFCQAAPHGIHAITCGVTPASRAQWPHGHSGRGGRNEAGLLLYRNWILLLVSAANAPVASRLGTEGRACASASTMPKRAVARDSTWLLSCTRLRRLHAQFAVFDTLRRASCSPRPKKCAQVVRMVGCRRALQRWAQRSRFERCVSQFLAAAAAAGAENAAPQTPPSRAGPGGKGWAAWACHEGSI